MFKYLLDSGDTLEHARSVTLMMAICFELLLAHSVRSKRMIHTIGFFTNAWILWATALPFLLQFVLLYTPMANAFHLVPLTLNDWGLVAVLSASSFVIFEGMKLIPEFPRRKKA